MEKIKVFLFDFGNVLYEISHERGLAAFVKFNPGLAGLAQSYFTPIIMDYESGKLSSGDFRKQFSEFINVDISDDIFDAAWNRVLVEIFPDSIILVKKFLNYGRAMLLSNTNEIHYRCFEPECRDLFALFENLYFSYKVGICKPDLAIYQQVISESGCRPNEIFFIDDTLVNVEAAARSGMQAYHCKKQKDLAALLDSLDAAFGANRRVSI